MEVRLWSEENLWMLVADKFGDSPIQQDMKLRPQTRFGAKSKGPYNWSQNRGK